MLLRHPDQKATPPGFEVVEPPRWFAEAAYECGIEPGSGTVRLIQGGGSVIAAIDASVRGGLRIHLRAMGDSNDEAVASLLRAIRRLAR